MNTLDFIKELGPEVIKFYEQACRGMFQAVNGKPGETKAAFEPVFELTFANNTIYSSSWSQIICDGTRTTALKYFGDETSRSNENVDESNYALNDGKALVSPQELLEAARVLGRRLINECPETINIVSLRLHGGESRDGVGRYLNLTELSLYLVRNANGSISDRSTCWRKPENTAKEIGAIALVKGANKSMEDLLPILNGTITPTEPLDINAFIPPEEALAEAASRLAALGFRAYKGDTHVQFYGYPKQFKSAFGFQYVFMRLITGNIKVPKSLSDIIYAIALTSQ